MRVLLSFRPIFSVVKNYVKQTKPEPAGIKNKRSEGAGVEQKKKIRIIIIVLPICSDSAF